MIACQSRLIWRCREWQSKSELKKLPPDLRGIYALLKKGNARREFDVVYIGMARGSIKTRLEAHNRSKKKQNLWDHFSAYAVWPNITDDEIIELEGLIRAIYRRDSNANKLAKQKGFAKLKTRAIKKRQTWPEIPT